MSANCCSPRRRLLSVGLAYTPAALLALLLPKCPLCLGALLAVLGVSTALPSYSYALIVIVSVALASLVLLVRLWRRRAIASRPHAKTVFTVVLTLSS